VSVTAATSSETGKRSNITREIQHLSHSTFSRFHHIATDCRELIAATLQWHSERIYWKS